MARRSLAVHGRDEGGRRQDIEDIRPTTEPCRTMAEQVLSQLERMLQSREFLTHPRAARILRFIVEESVRNGFKPISQRQIAKHALELGDGFDPNQTAHVRVNISRVRRIISTYYASSGIHDAVRLGVTTGPYRLQVAESAAKTTSDPPRAAIDARRSRPMLLVLEPKLRDRFPECDGFTRDVWIRTASRLIDSVLVAISGPLLRERITDQGRTVAEFAAVSGFEYVADPEISRLPEGFAVRLAVRDCVRGREAVELSSSLGKGVDTAVAGDAIAEWIAHRISDYFATCVPTRPRR